MKRLLLVAALAVSLFNATAQSYDVAAYLYPAYAAGDARLRPSVPGDLREIRAHLYNSVDVGMHFCQTAAPGAPFYAPQRWSRCTDPGFQPSVHRPR